MPILEPNIANLQAKRDVTGLIRALQSKSIRTRCDALRALGELRDARALTILRDWLLSATTATLEKTQAAEALGKLGDASVVDALVLANERSHTREKSEIDAAIAAPDKTYRPSFYVNCIAADEYALRAAIAHALAQVGDTHIIEKLVQMLAVENGAMASAAQAAIKAALDLALSKAATDPAPFLRAQLQHTCAQVREYAAYALAVRPDSLAQDALLDLVRDEQESFAVRTAAFSTLGKIADARALPLLEELLRSPNQSLAREAKQCLITIRQRLGLPTLTRF